MNCACFLAYEFFSIWVYWASHIYTHTHTLTYTYIPHPFSLLKGLYFVHVFVKTFSSPCGFCLWRTPGKKGMLYGTPQGTASQRSETSQRHKIFASLHLLYSENFGWNSRTSLLIYGLREKKISISYDCWNCRNSAPPGIRPVSSPTHQTPLSTNTTVSCNASHAVRWAQQGSSVRLDHESLRSSS